MKSVNSSCIVHAKDEPEFIMEAIDRNQAWFWSKKWQKEEKLVEKDFEKGNVLESKDVESFIEDSLFDVGCSMFDVRYFSFFIGKIGIFSKRVRD